MSPGLHEMSKSYQEVSKSARETPSQATNRQREMIEPEVESLGEQSEEEESNIYDDPIDLKLVESAKRVCDDVYSKVSKKPVAAEKDNSGCNNMEKDVKAKEEKKEGDLDLDLDQESLSNAIYASINKATKKNKEVNLESVTSTMI